MLGSISPQNKDNNTNLCHTVLLLFKNDVEVKKSIYTIKCDIKFIKFFVFQKYDNVKKWNRFYLKMLTTTQSGRQHPNLTTSFLEQA